MKRIVIDARESGTTTGRYVDKLVEHLNKLSSSELSDNYEVILLAKPHRLKFLRQLAPDFRLVTTDVKEFTFAEQISLKKQLEKLEPDLVFFPMVQQPVFYNGLVVTSMLDLTTIRFRNPAKNWLIFSIKQAVYKWVNKRVARKSAQIITPTEFVRQDVANYCRVSPKKITAIYDAADKITERAEPIAELKGKTFLLSVGRPAANKNLGRLVDAFTLLADERPDLYLVLAGKTGPEFEKLQRFAQTKKHHQRIIFTGFVSEGQLRWLYEQAAAYVFPSLSEGFGLGGLEAMQYSLPVVASQATCLPEVYQDGALYFDPLDIKDIAAKTGQVLDQPELAQQLSTKGKQVVKQYDWQKTASQTWAVFKKALGD